MSALNQVAAALSLLALSHCAQAQETIPVVELARAPEESHWQFSASLYGYLPEIRARMRVPADGAEIIVGKKDLIDHLKFLTMGSFSLQRGRWGFLSDLIYVALGGKLENSPNVAQGNLDLPGRATADAELDVKAAVLTIAPYFRVLDSTTQQLDLFAGARLLDATGAVSWRLHRYLGPIPTGDSAGAVELGRKGWDAIAGARGRYRLGDQHQWFIPYWLDAGAGESDLVWQAEAGLGYTRGSADFLLSWRHLDYRFANDRFIEELQFSGPALGFILSW